MATPTSPEPYSLHLPEFYRAYKHPPEIQPNHINRLSSVFTELGILKLIQGVLQAPPNTVVKMPLERYHILQNEIDPCAVKVDPLEGSPLREERAPQGRLFASHLGKARPGTAIKAIQTIPGAGETTGPRSGATVPGRPLTSPRRRRKADTAQTVPGVGRPGH